MVLRGMCPPSGRAPRSRRDAAESTSASSVLLASKLVLRCQAPGRWRVAGAIYVLRSATVALLRPQSEPISGDARGLRSIRGAADYRASEIGSASSADRAP